MAFNYTISKLKTDLENSIHGTTLNKVQGVDRLIERAGSQLLMELDPQETIRINQMTSPIYNQVYDYALPTDLKGTKIIDIRPQANRTLLDRYLQEYGQDFDIGKQYVLQPNFNINFNQGSKTIRIVNNMLVSGILLNSADTITGNGTWTVSGAANNLQQDNLNFTNGFASSLEFDSDTSGTNSYLTNSTMESQDLTEQLGQGVIFFYLYLPSNAVTPVTAGAVSIRVGSSASDYYSGTAAVWDGTALATGWNLMYVNWSDLITSTTGTPDITDITYFRLQINQSPATTAYGFRFNALYSRLGEIIQIVYYSKYLFQDASTGAFQQSITADTNIINLDVETRNLLYLLSGIYLTQQIQGLDGIYADGPWFQQQYDRALATYKATYKSQWQKPRTTYYGLPNPSNRNWAGGNRYNY